MSDHAFLDAYITYAESEMLLRNQDEISIAFKLNFLEKTNSKAKTIPTADTKNMSKNLSVTMG